MIGVICPSVFEYKALDILKLKKQNAHVLLSGMGKVRALYGVSELCLRIKPKALLLIGFAGGLTKSLNVGDLIEPDVFIEQDYFCEPFEKFPNLIRKRSSKILKHSKKTLMLTQDRFLTENPYKKGKLAKKYGRIACDMESYAFSYFCEQKKINYSVLKLVSDSANETADHDFLNACRRLAPKLNQTILEAVDLLNNAV